MSPWLSVVGIGEDGLAGLTPIARAIVDKAEVLVGGARHLAMVPDDGRKRLVWANPLGDTLDDFILHRAMILVAPPDQNIGLVEALLRTPVFRLLQRGGGGVDLGVLVQRVGNGVVHAVWIDRTHRLIDVFVDIFDPYNGVDGHFHAPR